MNVIKLTNKSIIEIRSPSNDNIIKIGWNSDDYAFEIIERDTDIIMDTKQEYKVLYFHDVRC